MRATRLLSTYKEQTGWPKKGNNNFQFFVSKYYVSQYKKHVPGCVPSGFGVNKKVNKNYHLDRNL